MELKLMFPLNEQQFKLLMEKIIPAMESTLSGQDVKDSSALLEVIKSIKNWPEQDVANMYSDIRVFGFTTIPYHYLPHVRTAVNNYLASEYFGTWSDRNTALVILGITQTLKFLHDRGQI